MALHKKWRYIWSDPPLEEEGEEGRQGKMSGREGEMGEAAEW